MNFKLLTLLFITAAPFALIAQDGHYWTQQYGTKSILLSNSVIGGTDDLGAVYYNPGRLAVISNAAFLLSANVYEYTSLTVTDAFGNGQKYNRSDIKGVPTLAAGTFKIKNLPKHFFAYSILTRQSSNINFSFRGEENKDVIAALPGNEYFGAEAAFSQSSSEQWIGLTWSYAVSPKISVGVTTNYTTNNQSKGININLQALSASNEVALYRFDRSFTFNKSGLLWKAGLAAQAGKWQLGLTVTTPMVNMSGNGSYRYEEFFSSIPSLAKPESYSTSYQKGLATTNKTPWSVGMGASRKLGRNTIHLSTEWFAAVSKYSMMRAADHISQSNPNDTIRFNLVDQFKSVWNAGIGAELYINDRISGFASFSTDFTAVTSDMSRFVEKMPEAYSSSWNADFYHFGGGIVLKLKGADITLGATHTGCTQSIVRPINFPENPSSPIFNSGDTSDLRWDRWRLVFAFSFPFLKDYAKKFTGEEEKK